jgi:hypothetical protein
MSVRDIETENHYLLPSIEAAFREGFLQALTWQQVIFGNLPEEGTKCEIISGDVILDAVWKATCLSMTASHTVRLITKFSNARGHHVSE